MYPPPGAAFVMVSFTASWTWVCDPFGKISEGYFLENGDGVQVLLQDEFLERVRAPGRTCWFIDD